MLCLPIMQRRAHLCQPGLIVSALFLLLSSAVLLSTSSFVPASSQPVDYSALSADLMSMFDADPQYDDGSRAPLFVLLAWHSAASFSQLDSRGGTDGAHIRFPPERDWPPNRGIGPALRLLDSLRQRQRDSNVSMADLITLAAVVAIQHMHGPSIPWRPGRTDWQPVSSSPPSSASSASAPPPLPAATASRIPTGNASIQSLLRSFSSLSLPPRYLVALSGAHALGRCHRSRSGYEGRWTRSPTRLSNGYFRLMLSESWRPRGGGAGAHSRPLQFVNADGGDVMMLPSDLQLLETEETRRWVQRYADDEQLFLHDFAAAFAQLIELGVGFTHAQQH